MMTHKMHLHGKPFEKIRSGRKTIESRLFDEKRQKINVGDTIIFVSRANGEKVEAEVITLLRYETFQAMFDANDPQKFGSENTEQLAHEVTEHYTDEEQRQYGVIGIEFKVI